MCVFLQVEFKYQDHFLILGLSRYLLMVGQIDQSIYEWAWVYCLIRGKLSCHLFFRIAYSISRVPEALLTVCINIATSWSLLKLHFNWRSFFSSYCHLQNWGDWDWEAQSFQIVSDRKKSESVHCSVVSNSVTPWIVACQAPLSMGFSRQEYWSGEPCPSAGDFPDLGIEPGLLHHRQIL